MAHKKELQASNKVNSEPLKNIPPAISRYLWFLVVICLAFSTIIVIFFLDEEINLIAYARYILGSVFILFLPGYTLLKALFPQREMSIIYETTLSVVLSMSVVIIVSFVLNFTSWGITLISETIILLVVTVSLAIISILRSSKSMVGSK